MWETINWPSLIPKKSMLFVNVHWISESVFPFCYSQVDNLVFMWLCLKVCQLSKQAEPALTGNCPVLFVFFLNLFPVQNSDTVSGWLMGLLDSRNNSHQVLSIEEWHTWTALKELVCEFAAQIGGARHSEQHQSNLFRDFPLSSEKRLSFSFTICESVEISESQGNTESRSQMKD